MMAPNGAALLSGFRQGAAMRRYQDQQAASALYRQQQAAQQGAREERVAAGGMFDDKLALEKAYDEDYTAFAGVVSNARPGDEGQIADLNRRLQKRYAGYGMEFPDAGVFTSGVRSGFGNRADAGSYFASGGEIANSGVAGQFANHIASIPYDELLTGEGRSAHEQNIVSEAVKAGLDPKWTEHYIGRLRTRATDAATRRDSAVAQLRDRQTYVNEEMKIVRDRAAMAFRSGSAGISLFGGPTSGMDPEMTTTLNIIAAAAQRLLTESYDRGLPMSAEDAIAKVGSLYPDVPAIQKAVGQFVKTPDGRQMRPTPFAIPGSLALPQGVATLPAASRPTPAAPQTATAAPPPADSDTYEVIAEGSVNGKRAYQVRCPDGTVRSITPEGWEALKAQAEGGAAR